MPDGADLPNGHLWCCRGSGCQYGSFRRRGSDGERHERWGGYDRSGGMQESGGNPGSRSGCMQFSARLLCGRSVGILDGHDEPGDVRERPRQSAVLRLRQRGPGRRQDVRRVPEGHRPRHWMDQHEWHAGPSHEHESCVRSPLLQGRTKSSGMSRRVCGWPSGPTMRSWLRSVSSAPVVLLYARVWT